MIIAGNEDEFRWVCGGSNEESGYPDGTALIVIKRDESGRAFGIYYFGEEPFADGTDSTRWTTTSSSAVSTSGQPLVDPQVQAITQELIVLRSSVSTISETIVDRCSADVYISPEYSNDLSLGEGIVLKRAGSGYTPWSPLMPANGDTWIRWWCHSTTGNWADPGTWRITGGEVLLQCSGGDIGSSDVSCKPTGSVNLGLFSQVGWTAQRSRCDSNHTKAISARLGPNRLLEIQCWE